MGELRDCPEGFGRSVPMTGDILLDDIGRRIVTIKVHEPSGEEFFGSKAYPINYYTEEEETSLWPASYRIGSKP